VLEEDKAGVDPGLKFSKRGREETAGTVGTVITGRTATSASTTHCGWATVQSELDGVIAEEAGVVAGLMFSKVKLEAQETQGMVWVGNDTPSGLERPVLKLEDAPELNPGIEVKLEVPEAGA
jgi:hypothetical protein